MTFYISGSGQQLKASAAGSSLTVSPTAISWTQKSFSFVATSNSTTLTFESLISGSIGAGLDHVSVTTPVIGGDKVTICHKGKNTITVGPKAAAKHIEKHGDTPGPC